MKLICGINNVTIEARDASGAVLQRQERHNRMVSTGRAHFRDLLQGVGKPPNYIACGIQDPIGIDDTPTELMSEDYRVEIHTRLVTDNKAIFMATFDRDYIWSNAYWDIREFGLFSGCSWLNGLPREGGVMICYVRSSPIDISDHLATIFVVWEIPLYAE